MANPLQLFTEAVTVAAEFTQHLSGDASYRDYRNLPNIEANPYNCEMSFYDKRLRNGCLPAYEVAQYHNTRLRQRIYGQIIENGALATLAAYQPDEDKAYNAIQTDDILYRSYAIMLQDKNYTRRLNREQLAQEQADLQAFPAYVAQASAWINGYFNPSTHLEKDRLDAMKQNILLVDIFTGRILGAGQRSRSFKPVSATR